MSTAATAATLFAGPTDGAANGAPDDNVIQLPLPF